MGGSDDGGSSSSSSSSSASSPSSPPSSSSSSTSSDPPKCPVAEKTSAASLSPPDAQLISRVLVGGAEKNEDGDSGTNSDVEGMQPAEGATSKISGRIRGGEKKRPRPAKSSKDQYEAEDSDNESASRHDEVHAIDPSVQKPSKRPRQQKVPSEDDVDCGSRADSPTTQYWSDQAKGPSGDGTIFEGMNQMAVADIVGWSHSVGGGNGSRIELFGGQSDVPIPPWGLSLHQPPPFQPMHSEAAPMRSEVPPPPRLLKLLLSCAEEKMNKSAERVISVPQSTEQKRKMKILRHMNHLFDSSALIAAGVAVEETLTSALLPLAAAHVSRCRTMDHQARTVVNRRRKPKGSDGKKDEKKESTNGPKNRKTGKKSLCQSDSNPKKGDEESGDQEEESVDNVLALDRDAFDAWTLPPAEALLQLSKRRKLEQKCQHKNAYQSSFPYLGLPSAAPTPKAMQQAIESAGSNQDQIQSNMDAAYDRSISAWCHHHCLNSETVREKMGDLFGLFLPKEPPRDDENPPSF